jgi:hypothetical protein
MINRREGKEDSRLRLMASAGQGREETEGQVSHRVTEF